MTVLTGARLPVISTEADGRTLSNQGRTMSFPTEASKDGDGRRIACLRRITRTSESTSSDAIGWTCSGLSGRGTWPVGVGTSGILRYDCVDLEALCRGNDIDIELLIGNGFCACCTCFRLALQRLLGILHDEHRLRTGANFGSKSAAMKSTRARAATENILDDLGGGRDWSQSTRGTRSDLHRCARYPDRAWHKTGSHSAAKQVQARGLRKRRADGVVVPEGPAD